MEGTFHIWIGFDHVLFLLSLLLPAVLVHESRRWTGVGSFRAALTEVLWVVTAFTVAHSITLPIAALQIVGLPSRLVESAIAASVVLAAANNLVPVVERRRWLVAFGFGLIHGFGFASVLTELGSPEEALVLSLLGFNVGVEIGQLVIVACSCRRPTCCEIRGCTAGRVRGRLDLTAAGTRVAAERAFNLKLIG